MASKDMTLRLVMKMAANDFTRGISSIQKQLQGLGSYLKTAFAVGSVVSFGREMVKWTKEFEDAMARAQAVSNASAEGFKFMRDEALRLGATTRYTSVEVAQTLEVLTRNGLSATNATRVLADTLKLAQANAVELADAGNMITNTLNMFGLSVNKAAYVTDILSATASHSATDLTSLYEAMTNAAPMAHALSIDIEEVSAALGALANVGVKGPDAGTQLRQFLQRLTDPLAMKKMKKLTGFSFDEDFINTEGLEGVLKKLQSMGLTVSQLNEIFTVRSSKSIIQLMNSMDNFNSLLRTMGEASGTASRMFVEGVGSMRYELDILRSMWQNYMIDIGNSTEGVFLGLVRAAQNAITTIKQLGSSFGSIFKPDSFKNWAGSLLLIISQLGVAYAAFHKKINAFFKSMGAGVKAWANESIIASKIEKQEHIKDVYEKILANQKLSRSQKMIAKERIAQATASINAYRAEQKAAQALKATISTIGWAAAIIAIEVVITKLVAMNAQIRQANESIQESEKASQNLVSKTNMLIDMIGDGSDKDSLNGAVNEAKRMFSEFADAINSAYIEAGKTGNYVKLKNLLSEIANLQTKIMASKANQELVDATREQFARSFRTRDDATSRTIRGGLKDQGFNKKQIDAVYNNLAEIIIRNNANLAEAVNQLRNYLATFNIKVDTEELKKWVKDITPKTVMGFWGPLTGERQDSPYTVAVNAYNRQQNLSKDITKDENQLKWKNAIDEFYRASTEALTTYKAGTEEYKEAMTSAFQNLKNAVGDIIDQLDASIQNEYNQLKEKYGGKGSSSFSGGEEGGSGSKKKTPQDKFNDIIQDYIDDSKKVEEQYKNGILTQQQYAKALSDVELEALKTIAGVADLDKMLKGLPESSKEAGKSLAGMIKDFNQKAAENILLDFDQKRSDIQSTYDNSKKDADDLKKYNDAMDDLANSTMEELSKIQNLNEVVTILSQAFRDLFNAITTNIAAQKEKTRSEQLDQLNKDTKIDVKEPKLKVILSPDDKSVEGMKQNIQRALDEENFDINIQIENDETILDATQDKVKEVEKAIDDLQTKIATNDDSISLIKEDAIERLNTLKNYLMELMNQVKTMEDKVELSKLIVKLNGDIKTLSDNTMDNISSMASAFDRLKDSVKDIAEAFDMDIEFEGLEKGITVINAIIQAIESVKEIMETFQAFQEMAKKRQLASNAELALSNATVAASESTKTLAAAEGAIANGAEIASASAAAQANQKQAASNYNVAASEATKAAAAGTSAVAQGAESVSKVPYIGAILAVAAAGAIAAALIAAFSKVKGFANGGIVGGSSFYGDKNLIRANSGEMVLTRGDQRTLFKAIKTGNFGGGGNVEFVIRGEQLVGTLNNYNRIHHKR